MGVLVVVVGSLIASVAFIRTFRGLPEGVAYRTYRRQLGRSIILGLEFLIAGDIIRTVVVSATLENIAALGLIKLIRSFLSLTLSPRSRRPLAMAIGTARNKTGSRRLT